MPAAVRLTLIASVLVLSTASARGDAPMSWFDKQPCASLEIKRYRSLGNRSIVRAIRIDDVDYVGRLVAAIERLPVDGDEMIDFAPSASRVALTFGCGGTPRTIEIISNHIKTPSTGFNSAAGGSEAAVVADVNALLAPDLGKRIPKVKGLRLPFKGFALTFTGARSFPRVPRGEPLRGGADHAPATVSGSTDGFLLEVGKKPGSTIEISSGQLPPAPQPLKLGRRTLSLKTYETSAQERLFPTHFQITR